MNAHYIDVHQIVHMNVHIDVYKNVHMNVNLTVLVHVHMNVNLIVLLLVKIILIRILLYLQADGCLISRNLERIIGVIIFKIAAYN